MRASTCLVASLAVTMALAGCHTQETVDHAGTDDGLGLEPEPMIDSVEIAQMPDSVQQGEHFTVCWIVEGTGRITHTDLHYDEESHAGRDPTEFHEGGAAWPDNATDEREDGYALPLRTCTTVPMTGERVFLRAHAMGTDPPGVQSDEEVVTVGTA